MKKIFFAMMLVACSDTTMDMPKNDSGTGTDGTVQTDSGAQDTGSPDVFMPDAGNACDKGIVFDNANRIPGWPNVPQP